MPAQITRQVAYKVWLKQIHESEYIKQEGWDPNYIKLGDKQISRINIIATVVGKFISEDGNYAALTIDDGTDTIRAKAFGPDVKLVEKATVGAVIRFVGKIKQYNEETYLSPEIIKPLNDPNWLILHRLELGKIEPRTGDDSTSAQQEPPASAPKTAETIPIAANNQNDSKLAQHETPTPTQTTPTEQITESAPAKSNALASAAPAAPVPSKPEGEPEQNISSQILALIQEKGAEEGAPTAEIIKEIGDEALAKEKIAELLASGEIYEPKKGFLKLL